MEIYFGVKDNKDYSLPQIIGILENFWDALNSHISLFVFPWMWGSWRQVNNKFYTLSSVQFSHSVVSDSLRPHELQHVRPPCPSPNPRIHWDSRPLSQWCHPAVSSSVIPFSSCPQSLSASVFSNESTLHMRWPKYWSFSFSIIPSKEIPGLISFITQKNSTEAEHDERSDSQWSWLSVIEKADHNDLKITWVLISPVSLVMSHPLSNTGLHLICKIKLEDF